MDPTEDFDEPFGASVAWETGATPHIDTHYDSEPEEGSNAVQTVPASEATPLITSIAIKEAQVELAGTKDMFVSYLVVCEASAPILGQTSTSAKRRFQDFHFLKNHLARDFPACVIPPLPDKHRMEYLTGDRFSPEFIERRRSDLQRFLERLARHPKLVRTVLFQNFIASAEWNVFKHSQKAHPLDSEQQGGILDNISDTLLNAFTKLKKPDERFTEIRAQLDQFEESLASIERMGTRCKAKLSDLSADYEDMASSIQGLGYLESGITDSLMRFDHALMDFSATIKQASGVATDKFLDHLHSLWSYSNAFRAVLKLRDQKQLDCEELSTYIVNVASERERLVGGYSYGLGLGSYLKDRVEAIRNRDGDISREAKIAKLEVKLKELQDGLTASQQISNAFNDEVLYENEVFKIMKRVEMKGLLGDYTDGQISLYKSSIQIWERTMPHIAKIVVETQ